MSNVDQGYSYPYVPDELKFGQEAGGFQIVDL
jgi:hypothetical protein